MIFVVDKPKHWYTRGISISIPLWPKWLAQRLCKHENADAVGWQNHETTWVCRDCYKCVIKPNICKHLMARLVTDTTVHIPYPSKCGGEHLVPDTWHCDQCGQSFTREVDCPTCNLQMEITEYAGMYSGRFVCTQCGVYYFREDL